jgi:hypothetical protein
MMPISVTLPDDLAGSLRAHEQDLPDIIALGLREWNAREAHRFAGLSSVLEALATLPTPEEVLKLRPSESVQARLEELMTRSKDAGLSPDEQREWDQYQFVEHLVRLAKARAVAKLKGA